MKSTKTRYICAAVFLLCVVLLAAPTFADARSKAVIGGADAPTVLFSLRQTVLSPKGIALSLAAVSSLVILILSLTKKNK